MENGPEVRWEALLTISSPLSSQRMTAVSQLPISPQTLIAAGAGLILLGTVIAIFLNNIRIERCLFWTCWLMGTSVMAFALTDRGWKSVVWGLAAGLAGAVIVAYFRTSYLKIGGRIYAYTIPYSRPDPPRDGSPLPPSTPPPRDAYRNILTAPKFWWTLAVITCTAGVLAWDLGMSPTTLGTAVLASALLGVTGHLDAREEFPIARRQFLQFGLIVIASIPVFLAPPISYVLIYWARGGSFRLSYRDNDEA